MGKDKDNTGKFVINYQYSRSLSFHKLLTKKRITKYYLCTILQVSQISTVTRLINQPYLLTLQQLINLSFALNVSLHELINVITEDFKNCATSFDNDLLLFVPPHIRDLTSSNEWFER